MRRRLSLSPLLIAVNVGLVLIAVCAVQIAAERAVGRFAERQALARLLQAGASAAASIERAGDSALSGARLLAADGSLPTLLKSRDHAGLARFLDRARASGRFEGCALVADGSVAAASGAGVPWVHLAGELDPGARPSSQSRDPADGPSPDADTSSTATALGPEQSQGPRVALMREGEAVGPSRGQWFLSSGSSGMRLVAWAPLLSQGNARVLASFSLDGAFLRALGAKADIDLDIHGKEPPLEGPFDPRAELRSRALRAEDSTSGRIDGEQGIFLAAVPLRASSGAVAGVIEAASPTAGTDDFLNGLRRSVLLMTLGLCSLAALGGSLVARRLIRPVALLTEASARIGRGDLATPIPRVPGAEIGALSSAMEDMRGRLLRLTAELTRRQAEAQAVVSGIVEGVFSVDRERRVQFLNPQAASLIGVTPRDALGRFCGDVLKPEAVDGMRPCEDRCPILHARFRGSARATEHLQLDDGRRLSVVITSAAPSAGAVSFEEGFSGDTSQYQVMRDETDVESARRARDGVLANISHEFRTPLTAQLASIELLRDRLPDLGAAEARTLVLSLERGTLRLTQLIDNLLESVRIESGRDSIRRQPVALDEVIEEAVELTSPLIGQREQSLLVDLPYPAPHLAGDAPRLVQVFVNLLANANKFAPTGSTIRIGGSVRNEDVVLWVEDQGPGLPPGDTKSLFGRFIRSGGEEPEPGGLGLGLWIVKSIVERHGGRVEAQSGADGPGTRVCVFLPRVEE